MLGKIKILLVEDNINDVRLLEFELRDAGVDYEITVVDNEIMFKKALTEYSPDIIVSDYRLPSFNGMDALKIVLEDYPLMPFIIATGSTNEEVAVECIKAGADDYIIKEHIKRIGSAIEGAIKKKSILKEKLLAVEALKQSEKKFRLLAYNSKDLIFRYKLLPEPEYEFVSPASIDLIGYTPEEHYADPMLHRKILHKDDKPKFEMMIYACDLYYKPVELRWQHKNGNWIWGEQINIPIYDEDKNLVAIEGTARDITERKKSELVIRNKEKELRTLTQNLPDVISRFSRDKKYLFVNESIQEKSGIVPELFIGKTNEELGMPEDSIKMWNEKIDEAFSSNKIVSFNFSSELSSKLRWFEARVIPEVGEDGSVNTVLCITRDITEEKTKEKLVLRANEQFRAVWENSFEAMRLTDSEGIIVRVNEAACKLYERSREELVGQPFTNFYKCKPDTLTKYKERFINRNFESKFEREIELNSGKKVWLELSNSYIEIKDQPVLLLSIFRDFTEKKIAEIEILNAKEKAEEMNRLKSTFLANMSHELRTPMIGILGFAEILNIELQDPALKDYANTIYISGKRLTETLNTILHFSTLESEKWKRKFETVNIVKVITEVVNHYLSDAREKNLIMEYQSSNKQIWARLDEKMFSQVISHLVNNAIKFTSKGNIKVESSLEKDNDKLWATIKVTDTGIGIPNELLDIIFEPFRQGSEGLNREYQGTGLGLTIAKKYTAIMGGRIDVQSKKETGSVFTIRYPALAESSIRDVPTVIEKTKNYYLSQSTGSQKPDILLVEDDRTNQLAVSVYLSDLVQLDVADNGESAISMAKTVKYSLILMDIGLKGNMNGLEAVKAIRKIEGYQNIPIAAVSAFVLDGDKERFLNEGCTHYLPKPFLKADLVKLVKDILKLS